MVRAEAGIIKFWGSQVREQFLPWVLQIISGGAARIEGWLSAYYEADIKLDLARAKGVKNVRTLTGQRTDAGEQIIKDVKFLQDLVRWLKSGVERPVWEGSVDVAVAVQNIETHLTKERLIAREFNVAELISHDTGSGKDCKVSRL